MKRRTTLLCVTALFCLSALRQVQAQTHALNVLHSFSAATNSINGDGSYPLGLILSGETLYGTAEYSGLNGSGAVFTLNTNGANFTNLYNFTARNITGGYANRDGAEPAGLVVLSNTLFGTADAGGSSNRGTVFAFKTDSLVFTNLHSFTNGEDGGFPNPGLILAGNTLYGTAEQGGSSGNGTIFTIQSDGTGFTNLHSFTALDFTNSDGAYPKSGLVISGNTLYGTASDGGSAGYGAVFALNTNGTGFTNLYSFTGGADGASPSAGLLLAGNTLYGTAESGGSGFSGTVFSLNIDGTDFTNLDSFSATSDSTNGDGSTPDTALVLSSNMLYGTASDGGLDGSGTVFGLSTNGGGFVVLHTFTGGDDGADPYAGLILSGATLFGAAAEGGSGGSGTVFSLALAATKPPLITTNPVSQTVEAGSNVTLLVAATGAGPLTYQWLFDGRKISGASEDSLTLKKVSVNNTGSYEVVVSNSAGPTDSTVAIVTVLVPPSITLQPANQTEPLAGNATFSVKSSGAPLTFQWLFGGQPLSNGGNISGSATNKLTIDSIMSNNVGSYSVVISNSATAVTSRVALLTLSVEKTKPSVAITSPKANVRTNAPVLRGTASDSVRVLNVEYWVTNVNNGLRTTNRGVAALTNGSGSISNWTIPATVLWPGTNTLAVQSSNYAGLVSTKASATFFYQVATPFQLQVNPVGAGSFTGVAAIKGGPAPSNAAALYIGEGYTLTAKPAKNWYLANWLTNGAVAGTNTTLAFIMEPNLMVTANFATNQFVGLAARYDGIFYPSAPQLPTETNSGLIYNLVLETNGLFSGKLYLASGTPSSFSGAFDRAGYAAKTIDRSKAAGGDVTLELNILWQSAPRQITGLVSNAGGWVSTNLSLCAATTNLRNFSNYTVLLPQDTNILDAPPSYGYALITNIKSMIHTGGALSDGTSFTSLVEPINEQDQFPVYASLYGNKGLLLGQLSLDDSTNTAAMPAGGLIWFKPSEKTGLYSNGFNTGISVTGSPWTNSASALAAFTNPVQLTFSGGGFASNFTNMVLLTSSNTLKWISGPNFSSGSIKTADGLLTVTFTNASGKKVSAYGTVLQNLSVGGGFFAGVTNSGTIILGTPASLNQLDEDQAAGMIIQTTGVGAGPPLPPSVQQPAQSIIFPGEGPPLPP